MYSIQAGYSFSVRDGTKQEQADDVNIEILRTLAITGPQIGKVHVARHWFSVLRDTASPLSPVRVLLPRGTYGITWLSIRPSRDGEVGAGELPCTGHIAWIPCSVGANQ
jgi:hypothetical protein